MLMSASFTIERGRISALCHSMCTYGHILILLQNLPTNRDNQLQSVIQSNNLKDRPWKVKRQCLAQLSPKK